MKMKKIKNKRVFARCINNSWVIQTLGGETITVDGKPLTFTSMADATSFLDNL